MENATKNTEDIKMPDKRVPRPIDKPETHGGEGTEYPLNSGGVSNYKEEKEEEKKALKRFTEQRRAARDSAPQRGGGFKVQPIADVLNQSQRSISMSGADNFLTLSYQDMLDFIYGENELNQLIEFVQAEEEYSFNPPTRDEFGQMLKFAVSRSDDNKQQKKQNRINSLPTSRKIYADPMNKAMPLDSESRIKAAHDYIHKSWNSKARRGVIASYGKGDFIFIHKNICNAMRNNDIEHLCLDNLDEVSGYTFQNNSNLSADSEICKECHSAPCKCKEDVAQEPVVRGFGLFNLRVGQRVVSYSRGGAKAPGEITKIDGSVANIQWDSGLITTELLASLVPD